MMRLGARLLLATALLAAAVGGNVLMAGNVRAGQLARRAEAIASRQPRSALGLLDEALGAWPTHPESLLLAAQLHAFEGEAEQARRMLGLAAEVSSTPGTAMRIRGAILIQDPETLAEGIALLERGMMLAPPQGPEAPQLWARLGEAAMDARQYGLAIWAFHRAQALGYAGESLIPNITQAYKALGLPYAAEVPTITAPPPSASE